MAWLFRFLLLLFVLWLLQLLIRSLISRLVVLLARSAGSPLTGQRQREATTISGKTVKDPQCGTHVATDLAVAARVGDKTFHFCSEKCRAEFLQAQGSG